MHTATAEFPSFPLATVQPATENAIADARLITEVLTKLWTLLDGEVSHPA